MEEDNNLHTTKRLVRQIFSHPIRNTILGSLVLGLVGGLILTIWATLANGEYQIGHLLLTVYYGILIGGLFVCPGILTLYNLIYLLSPRLSDSKRTDGRSIEYLTLFLGSLYSIVYAAVPKIHWESDWPVQLYNSELHAPIATWTWPTLITILTVASIGYLILRFWKLQQLPPLVAVLAMGALYLGAALCVVWIIQIIKHDYLLCLFPINLILIAAKTVKGVIQDWHRLPHEPPAGKTKLILIFHNILYKAQHWTWLGFLLALPLLGILIGILTLFGQSPDSIIQAWTETSDWTLSQQVAPQNIHMDMHYLCTVAAGGHKKIVKPLRVGKRHGHRVLINRQLCIANAFEQLLEERIPKAHHVIRSFYDKYGYPIAKHIRSPYTADLIWFLMKPLEWFFLLVLYLFDKNPENRIAVQYPHAPLPKK